MKSKINKCQLFCSQSYLICSTNLFKLFLCSGLLIDIRVVLGKKKKKKKQMVKVRIERNWIKNYVQKKYSNILWC